jgi:hypothetical protein
VLAPARRSAARLGDQTGFAALVEDRLFTRTRHLIERS